MARIDGRPVVPPQSATVLPPATNSPIPVSQEPTPSPAPVRDQVHLNVAQGSALTGISLETAEHLQTHQVQAGESLSTIARKYFGNPNLYMELFQANRDLLKHPNQLQVGMTLKLPAPLFPHASENTQSAVSAGPALNAYRNQNPLAYVTLASPESQTPAVNSPLSPTAPEPQAPESPVLNAQDFEHLRETPDRVRASQNIIEHDDAVKVNKRFDLHPALTPQNFKTQLPAWADKVSALLREHNVSINLPTASGQPVTVDAGFFEALSQRVKAGEYEQVKKEFQVRFGTGFVNNLFAVDDIAHNIKNDPYYQGLKDSAKIIDLAAVADNFNLYSDKKNYLAGTPAHGHKQIPVLLQMNPTQLHRQGSNQSVAEMLQDLAGCFNARGVLTHPEKFENKVYALLQDTDARRKLVDYFNLNSKTNLSVLVPAITGEGGMAAHQIDYNSYFAVGSVMLNRALGRNLKKAAMHTAQGKSPQQFKPVSMSEIIHERGQFEIVTRIIPNSGGKTFFQFNQAQNQAFLNGQLRTEGNSYNAFKLAYEVSQDLFSGMNRLSAVVDGEERKGIGRSTAQLFYFNQSRSKDYSRSANAAVELIDSNNTHVFFKAWDDVAYFR